jgi:hypothetical protein
MNFPHRKEDLRNEASFSFRSIGFFSDGAGKKMKDFSAIAQFTETRHHSVLHVSLLFTDIPWSMNKTVAIVVDYFKY